MQKLLNHCLKTAAALAVLLATFVALPPAYAQTAEQLAIFQNLPPEQQRAVMEALGQGGGTMPSTGTVRTQQPPTTVIPRVSGAEERAAETGGEPRLREGDTLLVEFKLTEFMDMQRVLVEPPPRLPVGATQTLPSTPREEPKSAPKVPIQRQPQQEERLEKLREQVRLGNPYRLNGQGSLELPGLAPIPLVGLTVYEAAQRLAAEPFLQDFAINLVRLPIEPTGPESLKPFGYDLFLATATTFAPATDIPVPAEYVIGPGDVLKVQLIGNTRGNYSLVVNRDGTVNFPELGPIELAGLTFDDSRAVIEDRVASQMIGVRASVTLGELRSMRVFVLGDAEQPGSYTVSSLSTITNALYVSGGVKPIGSLRNIQLKRAGRTVTRLDLYDLLLNGDTSNDVRLLPGDVIFIPPVGTTVGVSGEVRRPAIYELGGSATIADLLYLSGGLTPEADPTATRLDRIDARRVRTTVDVDLSSPEGRGLAVKSGDVLRVPKVRPTLTGSVVLAGHVFRPGSYEFRPGMRLTDLLGSVEDLKPDADLNYILIRRERPSDRRVSVLSADLAAALRSRGSAADLVLAERDRVYVFDTTTSRDRVVRPILDELERQSSPDEPSAIVSIGGKTKVPGQYPLEPGMRVSDLVRAGGSLDVSAYRNQAELTRYEIVGGEKRETALIEIDLARALAGDSAADMELRPFDVLVVKEVPQWSDLEFVTLEGEVRFPGNYPIKRGETLKSVIDRAGGLTELAFVEGSVFTRKDLKEREQKQLEVLADRLQRDLATLALQSTQSSPQGASQAGEAVAVGQNLLADLRQTEAVGRLVIDLDGVLRSPPGGPRDVVLRNGDRLAIPKRAQEVTVIGEVQSSTSHLYDPDWSRDDYIAQSGGATQKADEKRIFVIRANGSVDASSGSSRWFARSSDVEIRPGDTIVVPLDAERMRPLPLWTAVTTIIYNLAVAVAAVNSF